MSMPTKFAPLMQKVGGPRWWRWQNKMVLPETASFGTVASFGGISSGIPDVDSQGHRAPNLDIDEVQNEQWAPLKPEELWQRPVCSDFPTKDPWASYFLPQNGGSSTLMSYLPMLPERKLESSLTDVTSPSILIKRSA